MDDSLVGFAEEIGLELLRVIKPFAWFKKDELVHVLGKGDSVQVVLAFDGNREPVLSNLESVVDWNARIENVWTTPYQASIN